jgi:hypothetical protein
MKATAYLLRSGAVDVRPSGEQPRDFLAALEIDIGVSEDWPFLMRMAEKKVLDKYVIADGKALAVEPHCGDRTFRLDKKRFNANGEPHACKNRRK